MQRLVVAAILVLALHAPAGSAQKMRFWNLTANTITELYLAPAGTDQWGPNQTLNDDDKTVEADERLDLEGVTPGLYDVRFKDETGRSCEVRNVEVKGTGKYAFAIQEKQLKGCTQ
ncbi:MAG: hypothetical protein IRY94_01585 [Rhodospirillaceae bacterium]|nr:hypothetical protein [Rhodospirillaceae bacterium]